MPSLAVSYRAREGGGEPSRWSGVYKIAGTGVIVLLAIALVWLYLPQIRRCRELLRRTITGHEEGRVIEARISELRRNQVRLDTDRDFLEKIAREDLGLAKSGETVYKFEDEDPGHSTTAP